MLAVNTIACARRQRALLWLRSLKKRSRRRVTSQHELVMAVNLTPRFRRLNSQTRSFRETVQQGMRKVIITKRIFPPNTNINTTSYLRTRTRRDTSHVVSLQLGVSYGPVLIKVVDSNKYNGKGLVLLHSSVTK